MRLKSEFARSSVFHLTIMLKCCPPLYSAADSRAPHSKCRQRLQYAERQNKFLSILLENASHALRKLLKVISAVKIRSVWQSVHNLSCYPNTLLKDSLPSLVLHVAHAPVSDLIHDTRDHQHAETPQAFCLWLLFQPSSGYDIQAQHLLFCFPSLHHLHHHLVQLWKV